MKLGELLKLEAFRNRTLVSAEPNETVLSAIKKLSEHDRGSLPVCDNAGQLVGIISERDIVRKALGFPGVSMQRLSVSDVMSTQIVIATPEDDLSYAIMVMKEKRIRHLPVVEGLRVVGMISMRDLLGIQVEECQAQIRLLSDYVYGEHRIM